MLRNEKNVKKGLFLLHATKATSFWYNLNIMQRFLTKPWLRAFSGLSINLSAGWFGVVFIGPNVSFPKNLWDFAVLTADIILAIVFLLVTVWCEKELQKWVTFGLVMLLLKLLQVWFWSWSFWCTSPINFRLNLPAADKILPSIKSPPLFFLQYKTVRKPLPADQSWHEAWTNSSVKPSAKIRRDQKKNSQINVKSVAAKKIVIYLNFRHQN